MEYFPTGCNIRFSDSPKQLSSQKKLITKESKSHIKIRNKRVF